jgi:hypothetical protein
MSWTTFSNGLGRSFLDYINALMAIMPTARAQQAKRNAFAEAFTMRVVFATENLFVTECTPSPIRNEALTQRGEASLLRRYRFATTKG